MELGDLLDAVKVGYEESAVCLENPDHFGQCLHLVREMGESREAGNPVEGIGLEGDGSDPSIEECRWYVERMGGRSREHLEGEVDGHERSGWADGFAEEGEKDASAGTDVEDRISFAYRELVDYLCELIGPHVACKKLIPVRCGVVEE